MSEPEILLGQAAELGVALDTSRAATLLRYEDLLARRAVPLGAVARSDATRIRDRHIRDCLRAAPLVHEGDVACDLGSGAGLPGIVVAVAEPRVRVLLVESRAKRAGFLELAVLELGLSNADVVVGRAEELRRQVDACFARAFAPLPLAWSLARGMLRPGGRLIYFAGAELGDPVVPEGAALEAVVRTPVLESAGPLVIMTRQ
jgi:16S rRNA (guanine527-N7)-methyltransferase